MLNSSTNTDGNNSLTQSSTSTRHLTKSIGHFSIGEKLGEGTFSKVFIGTHTLTNENVAIKIIEKSQIIEDEDMLRIQKEITIHKKLRHHNLIQQYCIIETGNNIYIISEYCTGGELMDYIIEKGRLFESEACRIFQQIIAGVEYLHKMKVAHRDLKPENMLLEKKVLKIGDFGFATEYEGLISTACGSPCYAAPEMVTGRKYNGSEVDIWSCGVILYIMVCGYLPFEEEDQDRLFTKIATGTFTFPEYISLAVKDLLKKILTTDPSMRLTFEQIKSHRWFQAINNIPHQVPYFNSPGLDARETIIPLDLKIVMKLVEDMRFLLHDVISDVLRNKHNEITTCYYLLLVQKIRNGEQSVSDISPNSEEFINYIQREDSQMRYYLNNIDAVIQNKIKSFTEIINDKRKNKAEQDIHQSSFNENSNCIKTEVVSSKIETEHISSNHKTCVTEPAQEEQPFDLGETPSKPGFSRKKVNTKKEADKNNRKRYIPLQKNDLEEYFTTLAKQRQEFKQNTRQSLSQAKRKYHNQWQKQLINISVVNDHKKVRCSSTANKKEEENKPSSRIKTHYATKILPSLKILETFKYSEAINHTEIIKTSANQENDFSFYKQFSINNKASLMERLRKPPTHTRNQSMHKEQRVTNAKCDLGYKENTTLFRLKETNRQVRSKIPPVPDLNKPGSLNAVCKNKAQPFSKAASALCFLSHHKPRKMKEILTSIVSGNLVVSRNIGMNYQFECKYLHSTSSIHQEITFALDVIKLNDNKDYYLVKSSLLSGEASVFTAVLNKIKTKLIV